MSKLQGALGFRTIGAGIGLSALIVLSMSGASCGGSSGSDQPGTDAGNDTAVNTDTPGVDTKTDTKHDITPVDADTGPEPIGVPSTLLAKGTFYVPDDLSPAGSPQGMGLVTTDGYMLVIDTTAGAMVAVPLAGGTPIKVVDKGDSAMTVGDHAFVWSNVASSGTAPSFIGTFGVWSKANGYKELSTAARVGSFVISVDHKMIAYHDGESKTKTSIAVDNLDGGAKKVVVTGTQNDATCAPRMAGTATKVAIMTCDAPVVGGDAGVDAGDGAAAPITNTLVTYDVAGTPTPVALLLKNFMTVDSTGTKLFAITSTGAANVYAPEGTGTMAIDTGAFYGEINKEGTKILYDKQGTKAGTGWSADVGATPAPLKITADDAVDLFLSPPTGAKYMEWASTIDRTTGEINLHLAPLAGGADIPLSTDPASDVFGDPYTADGSMAVYYTNISASGNALIGDLDVLDLGAAGAKQVKIAGAVWVSFAPKGKSIVYNDNWVSGGAGSEGVADLRVVDASNPTSSIKLIAKGAENNFNLSTDRTKVVFATSDPSFTTGAGLYAATLP